MTATFEVSDGNDESVGEFATLAEARKAARVSSGRRDRARRHAVSAATVVGHRAMTAVMMDEEGAELNRLARLNRAEIARVRREIAKAGQVLLMVPHDYHDLAGTVYVRVTKAAASRIVGMCPASAEPFDLNWQGDKLYIPPAFNADTIS